MAQRVRARAPYRVGLAGTRATRGGSSAPPPSPFLSPPPLWAGQRGQALTGSPARCAPPRVGVAAGTGQPSCSAGRASGLRAALASRCGPVAVGSAVLASCTATSGAGVKGGLRE